MYCLFNPSVAGPGRGRYSHPFYWAPFVHRQNRQNLVLSVLSVPLLDLFKRLGSRPRHPRPDYPQKGATLGVGLPSHIAHVVPVTPYTEKTTSAATSAKPASCGISTRMGNIGPKKRAPQAGISALQIGRASCRER